MKILNIVSFWAFSQYVVAAAGSGASDGVSGYVMSMLEYESSAVFEPVPPRVFPRAGDDMPEREQLEGERKFSEFIEKQRTEILSDRNLSEAIRELIPGEVGDQTKFFEQAKRELKVERIKGTDLLKIVVRSGDKQFSCDLANELADRYLKNHRPKEGDRGPIIHQKAAIGVPVEKEKEKAERGDE